MTMRTVVKSDKTILCKPHCRKVRASIDLPALGEVFSRLDSASVLGGNIAKSNADRFSYWAAEPREVFEFKTGQEDPFGKMQKALAKYKLEENTDVSGRTGGIGRRKQDIVPLRRASARRMGLAASGAEGKEALPAGIFRGGWIGCFAYELGRYIEHLPATAIDDLKMPLIRLCFYDRVIAYDHLEDAFWLIALQSPGDIEGPQEKLTFLEGLLDESRKISVAAPAAIDLDYVDLSRFRCNMDKDYYLAMVKKVKRYIYDGDVYQINFSQRFEGDYTGSPIDLFHWENHYNPSGYAAYIDCGSHRVVSASPEMFITVADGTISTKPIKGTRPRINETSTNDRRARQINAENLRELLNSEKERAELNMIVDLERNDVARICEPGTRRVIQPRTIETYPTVLHAVATVAGRLRRGIGLCDILKAMFPGGSITGAPKIRSMEIIDETEPTARGIYTGSIGYIGIDGSVCLNIAIRTIIIAHQKAFAQAGGGIVADSDPEAEWDETITKARALLAPIANATYHA
ncbi:MAG: anthranilate synthase component I family protein [Phycisphaerales bacterium]|nr:MAG: anthranilate synthase component I family protein [Phycisphaerales bacterium]